MALSLATASLLGAGLSATGGAVSTILNNRAQRKLSMDMYNLQRKDALADWQRQVDYEAPSAQMARYKSAGLNPNLIYGSQQNSPTVRASQMDVPNLQPIPVPDIGGSIFQYQAIKKQQAQTDLTNQVIGLTAAKEAMLALQAYGVTLDNAKKEMTNDQYARLKDTYFETSLAALEKLQQQNAQGWQAVEYNARTMDGRVTMVGKRLAQMDASIGKIIEETINLQQLRPYKKRLMTAQVNNLVESTAGKALDNAFKKLTQADRVTAVELTMEILGKKSSGEDYNNQRKRLENLMLDNNVDMQGVRNALEVLDGIKGIVNPFKGKTTTTSTTTSTPKGRYKSESTKTEQ